MPHSTASQLTALFFVAFNLRVAMACIGPVLDQLRIDLEMSRGQLGLLSTLPVLCMSLFAPFAQRLSATRGTEGAILYATILIALSALVRAWAGSWLMLISAFTAGVGIAVTGTLLNTFVKQRFAHNTVKVSGLYSAALCLGAALAAGVTAPLMHATDSWRLALALWCIPGFFGAVLWWRTIDSAEVRARAPSTGSALPWNVPRAWLIMIFFGLQSITFYVVLAWLAPMYIELGWPAAKAGALLGNWIAVQVAFILVVAHFASRSHDRRPWLVACGLSATLAFVGFAFAPLLAPWLWVVLLGFASGGWFPLSMNLPLDYSESPSEAGSWTAMMLFGGYLISAGSPSLAGWARDAGVSYANVFAVLAVLSALLLMMATRLRPRATVA